MYGIEVQFKQGNVFSKPYTYLYDKPLQPMSLVLVDDGRGFYSVGRVKGAIKEPKLINGITYRSVTHVIE